VGEDGLVPAAGRDHAALRYDAHLSMLFTEVEMLRRPAAAAAAGFAAVESWWPFDLAVPADRDVDRFVAAVADAGVPLVGLNFFGGDLAAGDRGVFSVPGRETELRDSIDVAVGIGARLGVRGFNALYGRRIAGLHPARQDECALGNLAHAARAAAGVGAVVLLEPLSGFEDYPLRCGSDVLGLLDVVAAEAGADAARLLLDVYHLGVNGDDVAALVDGALHRIGHVQVADAPGRHEPGTGSLEVVATLDRLAAAGYAGWVGCEYVPSRGTLAGLGWLPVPR
jgi:hydroxypyruvate isomerase